MKISQLILLLSAFYLVPLRGAETPDLQTETSTRSYESPLSGAVEILYTPSSFPSYQWSNGSSNDAKVTGARLNFEWIPLGDLPYGKPVLGFGSGFSWINKLGLAPDTSGSLFVIPFEPYIGYRLDYFKNQVVVPFGKMGLGMAYVQEELNVPDGKRLYHTSYLGLDLSLGAEIWLNFIDRKSARNLDASTGINNVYLLVEYFKSRDLGARYANLSREEYRLGMRFEF